MCRLHDINPHTYDNQMLELDLSRHDEQMDAHSATIDTVNERADDVLSGIQQLVASQNERRDCFLQKKTEATPSHISLCFPMPRW